MKNFIWALLKILAFLFAKLPRSIRFFFGDCLGLICFDVLRIRRKIIMENLQRAFPEKSKSERFQIGRRSFLNMGRNLTEYAFFPFLEPSFLDGVHFTGLENIDRALEENKGVCLVSLHLGNGDLAGAVLALKGYSLVLISKIFKIQWINEVWFGLRQRVGVQFIPPRNSSYTILKALKKNEIVVFVMDQFMGPPIGAQVNFFGYETGAALGLAVIAQRSQAPVVPIYTFRDDKGETHIYVEPEIPFVEKGDKGLAYMTQVYTDWVEEKVRERPEQWMWLHRRWKKFQES